MIVLREGETERKRVGERHTACIKYIQIKEEDEEEKTTVRQRDKENDTETRRTTLRQR